jgi:hypothetical protein
MKREKTLYAETYRKGAMKIPQDTLPTLRHFTDVAQVKPDEAFLLKAGVVERDGVKYDFNDIRVYLKRAE